MPRDFHTSSTQNKLWGYQWGRFYFIIVSILLLIGVSPFIENYQFLSFATDLFLVFVFSSILFAVSDKSKHWLIMAVLILPYLASLVSKYWITLPVLDSIGNLSGAAFIAFSLYAIGRFIARQDEVSRDVIGAAIVFYLLMGLMWGIVFDALENFDPGSFSMGDNYSGEHRMSFIYYSFVTLTTLGFGDITPITSKARALSIIEAIIGQLYLVIQIAWLVGMHISRTTERKSRRASDRDRKPPS